MQVALQRVAHVRAGDKGNTSNIAVIAYAPEFFPLLADQLTVEAVLAHYRGRITGPGERYLVESLGVMNFVLGGALGGGVSRTLNVDNFGKALGSALLSFRLVVPDDLAGALRGPGPAAEI